MNKYELKIENVDLQVLFCFGKTQRPVNPISLTTLEMTVYPKSYPTYTIILYIQQIMYCIIIFIKSQ